MEGTRALAASVPSGGHSGAAQSAFGIFYVTQIISQKGDVYSFAIILQQIILRSDPFDLPNEPLDLNDFEILKEVRVPVLLQCSTDL